MDGYEISAAGTLVKTGATILETGTRVVIRNSIYTGTITGGDFCGGTSYVIETDFTGMKGLGRGSRQTNKAETLLSGEAAIEHLLELKARAERERNGEEVAQFDFSIERLADDAETAARKSREGGYYRR